MSAVRSPSSPSRSLATCFSSAMKLFNAFPNAPFDSVAMGSILGMSATSGSFKGLLSDLKQYGLIEKRGEDEYAVSDQLKDFNIAQDAEKDIIRFEFATKPTVFSQIIENQGNHLPEDSLLANILTVRFGFNQGRAQKVVKALKESLQWANAIDQKGNVVKPRLETAFPGNVDSSAEMEALEHQISPTNQDGTYSTDSSQPQSQASIPKQDMDYLVTEIPLQGTRKVRIEYPLDVTTDDSEKVCAVFKALCQG